MINTTVTGKHREKETKCCCEPAPELPPEDPQFPIRAELCTFDKNGEIKNKIKFQKLKIFFTFLRIYRSMVCAAIWK